MISEIEGIIVSERNHGETSKIINIMTKEYGLIGVIAKGCKTLKSELRNVTGKLTYGKFYIYYKKDKLSILKSVDVIDSFLNIKKSLPLISYSSLIIELAEQVIKQTDNEEVYTLLIEALKKINENFDYIVITSILKLKYLDFLGVMPVIDECSVCGSKLIKSISADHGGYLCGDCLNGIKPADNKTIKLIRMFFYVDISKINKIDIEEKNKKEIDDFLNSYYDKYTGIYLKNKKFVSCLNQICY